MKGYFDEIEKKVKVCYSIAQEAREKGFDPKSIVEIPLATSLAERTTAIVSVIHPQVRNVGIEKRIKELEKKYGVLDANVAFKIAEEVAKENFCKFKNKLEAIDAGIRIGIAYLTLGIVASPIEGFTKIEIKKTFSGKDYFAVYFSGPIRSAGGTAAALSVVLADFLREKFGYAEYDPTELEVKRGITEIYDYHERITNLQYLPKEEELKIILSSLPVEINGEASEEKEVSNYKDLERIETNFIRSGFCLVVAEGIAQKASKLFRIVEKLRKETSLEKWDFLKGLLKIQKKEIQQAQQASFEYIKDIVAGRPIFGHPSYVGAFRLRYGRTRASGYSAVAISNLTLFMLDNFVAIGTQLRLEKPSKSAAVTVCDKIEGPIVRLKDKRVVKIKNIEQAKSLKKDVEKILYLGDILISYGDFYNRSYPLLPCGFNEEQWLSMIKTKEEKEKIDEVDINKAIEISKKYAIPLHPSYTFFWKTITKNQLLFLLECMKRMKKENEKIFFEYNDELKKILELIGVEHYIKEEKIVLEGEEAKAFLLNLGDCKEKIEEIKKINEKDVLKIINSFNDIMIEDKAGTFVGARMGRPEKAKLRVLKGSPNVLFPVGEAGGRLRSVYEAAEKSVKADFPIYVCECGNETIYYICENCGKKTKKLFWCEECQKKVDEMHIHKTKQFMEKRINIAHYLEKAIKTLNLQKSDLPKIIKGVKGTSSLNHVVERLEKGILRAIYGLHVNKDGTIRYDTTELPLTHFKPSEIDVDIETLKKLGYTHDIEGNELTRKDQLLELKPHDIILPACPDNLDENADDVFLRIANFIDNLLVRFYSLRPFYNLKSSYDLIGHLFICIAPHNSAAVVGRLIGFSKAQALYASPYLHAAMRRDADGDECAIILLLDALLNFSREYLPAHRGGTQDAPLIINARLYGGEVDDMVFDIEILKSFPFSFYEAAAQSKLPQMIKIEQIKDRIGKGDEAEFSSLLFTHDVSDINLGPTCSFYKKLPTMEEKVKAQMQLVEKIAAVDEHDVARLVIERHLLRDIRGNLRKFSSQEFRCVQCNEKYRRPPLSGSCAKCSGNIIFTVSHGGIIKYLELASQLASRYIVPQYIKQSLELTEKYIESIFGKESEKQLDLEKWF